MWNGFHVIVLYGGNDIYIIATTIFFIISLWNWTCAIPPYTLEQLMDPSIAMPLFLSRIPFVEG